MADEDFSFPATTAADSQPHFVESPPLWRCSPSPSSRHEKPEKVFKGKRVEDEEKLITKRSKIKFCHDHHEDEDEDEDEEKMDMLWENLNNNDEFLKSSCVKMEGKDDQAQRSSSSSCVKSLKLPKKVNIGQMVYSGKKPSILVFIKVLKKVFFMHSSSSSDSHRHKIKKRAI